MLHYLEAKVSIKVDGISGPFEQTITWLVNAKNMSEAKSIYENRVRADFSHMQAQSFRFEYLKVAGEI